MEAMHHLTDASSVFCRKNNQQRRLKAHHLSPLATTAACEDAQVVIRTNIKATNCRLQVRPAVQQCNAVGTTVKSSSKITLPSCGEVRHPACTGLSSVCCSFNFNPFSFQIVRLLIGDVNVPNCWGAKQILEGGGTKSPSVLASQLKQTRWHTRVHGLARTKSHSFPQPPIAPTLSASLR